MDISDTNIDMFLEELKSCVYTSQAENILQSRNIDKKFTNHFLSCFLFVSFPEIYNSETLDINDVAQKVVNDIDFKENFELFLVLLDTWKHNDLIKHTVDIEIMKNKTFFSQQSALDDTSKQCFNTQLSILNEALLYFEKKKTK